MTELPESLSGKTPIILYELNEVPWRVIDWYLSQRPDAALAQLLRHSATFTTVTTDEGELHPWSTWPTFHRGVDNRQHKIRFLNQDKSCAAAYPPIWEEAAKAGVSVGVFGSLQSYPPPADGHYAYYVPDTFAPGPETHPPEYSVFQRVNLRQTRADGAEASEVRMDGDFVLDVLRLTKVGLSAGTYAALAKQLLSERFDARHKTRRPMLQAPVAFDVFWHALNRKSPEFTTFFTNHVAGVMHRYWKYSFPEDFGYEAGADLDPFYRQSLLIAMDIADGQIRRLKAYVDARRGQLIVASSMGQEAIDRGPYHGEPRIEDPAKFMRAIGFPHPFKDHLAMQPDFNFEFRSVEERNEFCALVERLVDGQDQGIFTRCRWQGNTVNLALGRSPDLVERQAFFRREGDGTLREISFAEAGVRKLLRDVGTGYHQPKGSLIWYQSDLEPPEDRPEINSTEVRNMLLSALEVA